MRVVGLDLSTRSCGIARTDGRLVTVKPRAGAKDPARRLHEIASGVMAHVHPRTDVVWIEDYNPGGIQGLTMAKLGEVGGVVKLRLFERGIRYELLNLQTLKAFGAGRGGASKDEMVEACRAAGGCPANDDEADAFWLRRYGLEHR